MTGVLLTVVMVFVILIAIGTLGSTASETYQVVTMVFFACVALWQVGVLIMLYFMILRYFKGDLDREYRLLVICQSVLALGYILRFFLIILVVNKNWIDFTRDYSKEGEQSSTDHSYF